MYLATDAAADARLERDPLALLIGMLLDQQVPMEKAFSSPELLATRMGLAPEQLLDARAIAESSPDDLLAWFKGPPALHRFPGSMADRTRSLCEMLLQEYDADAAAVWTGVTTGQELVNRLSGLPGFGAAKARIFAALLAKQRGIRPPGWEDACGDYAQPGFRSVADIVDEQSLQQVREHKKALKAAAKAAATGATTDAQPSAKGAAKRAAKPAARPDAKA
jgi:uncharacterized HhH-GPD family protein